MSIGHARVPHSFIIFEFLGLEYGKIDTRIKSVTSVLDEIRKVTENVTSQSLSRSRARYK